MMITIYTNILVNNHTQYSANYYNLLLTPLILTTLILILILTITTTKPLSNHHNTSTSTLPSKYQTSTSTVQKQHQHTNQNNTKTIPNNCHLDFLFWHPVPLKEIMCNFLNSAIAKKRDVCAFSDQPSFWLLHSLWRML